MRKLLIALILSICLPFNVYSWYTPPGVVVDSNCDQAAYYPLGSLCQSSVDGKLYKGTGVSILEVAAGASTGDVVGPATNTANYIPQWNGANSKTLKDGLPISANGATIINQSFAQTLSSIGAQADLGLTAKSDSTSTTSSTTAASSTAVKSAYDLANSAVPSSTLRTTFQVTPDNTHIISEKLAKDSLDAKAATNQSMYIGTTEVPINKTSAPLTLAGITLTTPNIGVATATSVNKMSITSPASGSTLAVADGKTLTASNTLTLAGTDSSVITFPAASGTVAYAGTMSSGKICTSNADGKTVDCNTETPTGLGTITTVGDITTGPAFTAGVPGKTLVFNNATSGTLSLQTQTGALGSSVISLPAGTGTLALTDGSNLAVGSDTRGDLLVRGASVWGRKAIGATGKILTSDGTDPGWSAFTVAAPGAQYALLSSDGTNWIRVATSANITSLLGSADYATARTNLGVEPAITTLSIAKGGTNSSTSLNNGRVMVSSGGAIVESSTTSTTLGYLDVGSSLSTLLSAKAPLANPTFTGVPAAPTAAVDTNSTQLATTAYVLAQASASGDGTPAMDGTAARGTGTHFARNDHIHPTDTSRSPTAGSSSITTLGTISTGVWNSSTKIAAGYGGTGVDSSTWTGVPKVTSGTWSNGYTVGTSANNLVQLNSSAKLPAIDGSLLTNLPVAGGALAADGTTALTGNWDATGGGANSYTITAGGFTAHKSTGVAGDLALYEANSTDTDTAGFRGPTSLSANTSYRGQMPTGKATSDNMVLKWDGSTTLSGDGTPSTPYVQAMTFVDLDNWLALSGGTLTGKLITATNGTAAGFNMTQSSGDPSSPVNGDLWILASGLYARINGSTVGPFSTGAPAFSAVTAGTNTNALLVGSSGSLGVTGSGTISATSAVAANEASDATSFPLFATAATGSAFKTNTALTFDSSTGALGATTLKAGTATLTGGTNTFNLENGTASLDVAAGAAVDVNASLTVNTAGVTLVGKSGGSSVTFPTAINFDGTLTDGKLCTYTSSGNVINCNTTASGTGDFKSDGTVSMTNGATSAGYIKFLEDSDNGTNTVQLIGPASTADVVVTLPAATGTINVAPTTTTAGQALIGTTTAGLGAWTTGALTLGTNLTTQTGAVTLTGNASGSTLVLPSGSLTLGTAAGLSATSPTFTTSIVSPQVDFGTTGGRLSASSGVYTMAGLGNTNNENLTFNFEGTANTVTVASGTGVTDVNFSALNLVTTGNMMGSVNRVGTFASPITSTGTYSLTAANSYNSLIFYNDTDTLALPAAVAGMNLCVYVTGTNLTTIDPNGTDVVVRDGTAQSAGVSFTVAGVAGNYVCVVADAANHWTTMGYKGTLAQGS
jgi:hypothetical protein